MQPVTAPWRRPQKYETADFEKYLLIIPLSDCKTRSQFRCMTMAGHPSWWTVFNFAKANPEYAARLEAALSLKFERGKRASGGYRRCFTEAEILKAIEAFASFTGASAFYFRVGNLPRYPALVRQAARSPSIANLLAAAESQRQNLRRDLGFADGGPKYGRGHKRVVTESDRNNYISAIASGVSCKALEASTPFSKDVRERICKEEPAFAAAVALANRERLKAKYEASAARLRVRERERSRARRAGGPTYEIGQLRIQLNFNEMYVAADHALSSYRHIPDHILDDIRSDMVEAMIDGSLLNDEADERAFEYVEAHNRHFSPHNFKSTNQRLYEDGERTIEDQLTADDYCYAE